MRMQFVGCTPCSGSKTLSNWVECAKLSLHERSVHFLMTAQPTSLLSWFSTTCCPIHAALSSVLHPFCWLWLHLAQEFEAGLLLLAAGDSSSSCQHRLATLLTHDLQGVLQSCRQQLQQLLMISTQQLLLVSG